MAQQLQILCGSPSQLFEELRAAKSDVSWLSTAQLLVKDLKVAAGIPIVGLPIKVQVIVNYKYNCSMLLIPWGTQLRPVNHLSKTQGINLFCYKLLSFEVS